MSVDNLSYKIENKQIINDLSFVIKDNSVNAFLSSNNSGKTTLIKLLSGIIYNESGKIVVNDITLNRSNFKKYIQNISTILDDIDESFLCDTVIEEIKYPLINLKYSKSEIENRIDEVLSILDLNRIVDKKINELDYFEKVKVLLAASIAHNPKVLLIDDLLRFLTLDEKKEIINIFKKICNDDISIIFTTSSLNDLKEIDNIYVLNDGKIAIHDSFENIILKDNELSKMGIEIPLMIDLSRKLQFYELLDKVYYDPDKVVDKLWK